MITLIYRKDDTTQTLIPQTEEQVLAAIELGFRPSLDPKWHYVVKPYKTLKAERFELDESGAWYVYFERDILGFGFDISNLMLTHQGDENFPWDVCYPAGIDN